MTGSYNLIKCRLLGVLPNGALLRTIARQTECLLGLTERKSSLLETGFRLRVSLNRVYWETHSLFLRSLSVWGKRFYLKDRAKLALLIEPLGQLLLSTSSPNCRFGLVTISKAFATSCSTTCWALKPWSSKFYRGFRSGTNWPIKKLLFGGPIKRFPFASWYFFFFNLFAHLKAFS